MWLLVAIIQTYYEDKLSWFTYFWYIMATFYLGVHIYQKSQKYLSIENEVIKQNWPFGKKFHLNEIKKIKHFGGEYNLKTDSKQMKIKIDLVEKESLSKLVAELKKIKAEWI